MVTGFRGLLPKQQNAIYYLNDAVTDELLYGGAAGGGKTALMCLWEIEKAQKYRGSRWVLGRSKLKQLKETTLRTFYDLSSELGLAGQFRFREVEGRILWNNGSEILLKDLFRYPADPEFDSLGSLEVCGAGIDECNQVVAKARDVLSTRIRYKLDHFGITPKMLMTCNPAKNWVYKDFYYPHKLGKLPRNRMFIRALPTDNPYLPASYIRKLQNLPDRAARERLYLGNWEYDDDPAVMVDQDKINDAFHAGYVPKGGMFITADIARQGRDRTVIGVWCGWRLIHVATVAKNRVTEAASLIDHLRARFMVPLSNVVVDEDGVGGGVVDILGCKGFVNNSSPLPDPKKMDENGLPDRKPENFDNHKSQCAFRLARKIQAGEIYIGAFMTEDQVDEMAEEMGLLKKADLDKDGKQKLVSKKYMKEMIGRSPDYLDMLLMRSHFEYRTERDFVVL